MEGEKEERKGRKRTCYPRGNNDRHKALDGAVSKGRQQRSVVCLQYAHRSNSKVRQVGLVSLASMRLERRVLITHEGRRTKDPASEIQPRVI